MHRNRIMNSATDAAFVQLFQFGVAIFHANSIDVIDMLAVLRRFWKDEARRMAEKRMVTLGVFTALFVALREMFQFDPQNCALNSIHAAVPADHAVMIFFGLTRSEE